MADPHGNLAKAALNDGDVKRAFEVLLRRLHALNLADKQGNWELACLMEEVPSAKTPMVHEVIVKDIVTLSQLIDKTGETGKGKTPGLENE